MDPTATMATRGCPPFLVVVGTVGLLLLLAVLAIPSFMKSRTVASANSCINNLRQIQSGKEQAAMANGWSLDTDCDLPANKAWVDTYIRGGAPSCRWGGTYRYGSVCQVPTCDWVDPAGKEPPHVLQGYGGD